MTESELIERAAGGHADAIRTLYDRHSARVYSVARRITGDEELARDCAQEAWVRAIRGLPDFRGDALFSTWIHRIAVNTAIQGVRKARVRAAREVQEETPTPEAGRTPFEPADILLERCLERALDRLPPGMRAVLLLHDAEGYTHQEIGEQLGITPGTSKSQLFKARARMRTLLAGTAISPSARRHPGRLSEGAEA